MMKIRINDIKVNPGRRGTLEKDVEELAASIMEIGLLNPITLTEDHALIAGLHRLEAVKLLGWTEVECSITGLNGLSAELAELDENFARANLSPLELGELLARRKDIYESLYPETKAGVSQAIAMNKAKGNNVNCNLQSRKKSFIEDSADVMGTHPSTIARHIKIATELVPEAKEILRTSEKPVSSSTLKKISKLAPEKQAEASSLLVSGKIRTVDEYLTKPKQLEPMPNTQEENPLAGIPSDQAAVIMGMAYFTDGINDPVKGFLRQEDVFTGMSRDNIHYLLEMMEAIQKAVCTLGDMLTDCYCNS